MAILTRVTRKEYPGAITEIRVPYSCTVFPTIQELAKELMKGDAFNKPSVIINGKIFSEATEADLTGVCEP